LLEERLTRARDWNGERKVMCERRAVLRQNNIPKAKDQKVVPEKRIRMCKA
jgi:hypothetical protein